MKKMRIPVAREGYPFIALAAFATFMTALLGYDIFSLAGFMLTAFILFFFRDPERVIPDEDDVLVSPADGRVILIEKIFDDRFVKEHVYKISIFMNIFNVHVNRMPFSGTIDRIKYAAGSFYSANTQRGALKNEYCALILTTPQKSKFAVVQVAGLIARRIVCWAVKGDSLVKGQRFGLIRFGSRVDLYLPANVQLEVSMGQKVKAGETILGYLPS